MFTNVKKTAFETLTVSTSAAGVGFTAATINPMTGVNLGDQADFVLCTVKGAPIRYGDGFEISVLQWIKNFLAIRDTTATGDALVTCTYGWSVR